MKNLHLFTTVIGAAMLAAAPALAGPWDFNPDTAGGIMEDLDNPAYVGTSLPDTRERLYIGGEPNSAFPDYDKDETGYAVGTAEAEKGRGDQYGLDLFDLGTMR